MVARTITEAERGVRDRHMESAIAFAEQLCKDAELRGLSGYDLVKSLAGVMAVRDPTLAGDVLVAVGDAIRLEPVRKVIIVPA
jgi:hypothetical protein